MRNSSRRIMGSSRTSSSSPVCFSSWRKKLGSCSTRYSATSGCSRTASWRSRRLVAVAAGSHVDESNDVDPADGAQPQLARDLARGLDVGLENRALRVFLPGIASRIHVDRGERLGRLDDEVAARRQLDAGLEQAADLGLDVVLVEQRGLVLVQRHATHEVPIDLLQVADDLLVQLARIDEQGVDLVAEQVPDRAAREARLALQQARRV